MTHSSHLRIVKVGGSLLEFDRLADSMRNWLERQPPAITVFLAGGGPLVDSVRREDERLKLGDEAAHWLSIDAMDLTARIVARLLPDASLVDEFASLKGCSSNSSSQIVFVASAFLRNDEPLLPGTTLPHDWTVTSDSIAARLAETLQADELTLLKSKDPMRGQTSTDWAADGLVDEHFPLATAKLPVVRWVNLRSDDYPECLAEQ